MTLFIESVVNINAKKVILFELFKIESKNSLLIHFKNSLLLKLTRMFFSNFKMINCGQM